MEPSTLYLKVRENLEILVEIYDKLEGRYFRDQEAIGDENNVDRCLRAAQKLEEMICDHIEFLHSKKGQVA